MTSVRVLAGALSSLAIVAGVANAQCMGPTNAGFDFAPAPNALFETDFSDAPRSAPPKGIRFVSGGLAMADWEGKRAIQATSRATILVPTAPLSGDFSIEIGLVHRATRQIAGPSVSVYGGRTENFYPGSSTLKFEYGTVYWAANGGGAKSDAQFSSEEADECVGAATTFRLQGEGADIKAYAGQRLIAYMQDVKFNRAGGVMIQVGGGADDNAVYITSIRVGGAGPATVAANAPSAGTPAAAATPAAVAPAAPASDPMPTAGPPTGTVPSQPTTTPVASGQQVPAPAASSAGSGNPATATTARPPVATGVARGAVTTNEPEVPVVPPSLVKASYLGGGRALVEWSRVPGAMGYYLLQRLPNGQSAGILTEAGFGSGADTMAVTIPLGAGAIPISVVASFEPGMPSSVPSAPATVHVPLWYGRYRATVNGFRAHRATLDNVANIDGKGDEIYVSAAIQVVDSAGNRVGSPANVATHIHGDVNHSTWSAVASPNHRYRAGTATGGMGGILSGNGFPMAATPWQRTTDGTSTQTFPLLLWEGDLHAGGQTVEIVPELWESDEGPGQATPRGASAVAMGFVGVVAPAVARLNVLAAQQATSRLESMVLQGNRMYGAFWGNTTGQLDAMGQILKSEQQKVITPLGKVYGFAAAVYSAPGNVYDNVTNLGKSLEPVVVSALQSASVAFQLALNNRDRQIGIRENAGRIEPRLKLLTLSQEAAARIIAGDPTLALPDGFSLRAPGIVEIRYTDTAPNGMGDYSLYVEIRKLN